MVAVRKGTSKLSREKILARLAAEKAVRDAAAKAGANVAVVTATTAAATTSAAAAAVAAPTVALTPQTADAEPVQVSSVKRGVGVTSTDNYTDHGTNTNTGPRSSNLIGQDIKTDKDGRMDLSGIEDKHFLEQLVRGTVVPTEQMVGIAKDVAYGVDTKNQATMESGLDLVLNPLIKPFVDQRMRDAGIITDQWYWPEELKADWKVLPEFMQKGSGDDYTPETRTFLEGAQANVGNIGAVVTNHEAAGFIRDEEFKVSADRFERAPGYYIGSALGEIPYFLIGAGQIKAVATISAKSTAGIIRGTVTGTAGVKLIARAYRIEEGARKTQLALDKQTQLLGKTTKFTAKTQVLKAVELLKAGYSDNVIVANNAVKSGKIDGVLAEMAQDTAAKANENSLGLNSFKNKIKDVEDLPETTDIEIGEKIQRVEVLTRDIQDNLMPQVKQFKNQFLAETVKISTGTRAEKLARFVQGSPGDVSTKIDNFFNRYGKTVGDKAYEPGVNFHNVLKERYLARERAGEFSGAFGSLKLNRELYGNVVTSALGIDRATAKMTDLAGLVSRTVNVTKTINVSDVEKIKSSMDDDIVRLKFENDLLESFKLRAGTGEKMTKRETDAQIADGVLDKGQTLQERITINSKRIEALDIAKEDSFTSTALDFKMGKLEPPAFDSLGRPIGKKGSIQKVFSYDALEAVWPEAAERFKKQTLQVAVRPSVNVRKSHGIIHGTIGDTPETSMSFWLTSMDHKKASTAFGPTFITDSSIWKQIGLKKFNTPIGKYRSILPWKASQQEQILTIYQASDNIRVAGRGKAGVKPTVVMNKNAKDEIRLLESAGFLEKKSTSAFSTEETMLGAGPTGNKRVFEYSMIPDEKTKKMIDLQNPPGDNFTGVTKEYNATGFNNSRSPAPSKEMPTVDTQPGRSGGTAPMFNVENTRYIDRIEMRRAMIENRPDNVISEAKNIKKQLEYEIKFEKQKKEDAIKKVQKSTIYDEDAPGYMFYSPDQSDIRIAKIDKDGITKVKEIEGNIAQLDNTITIGADGVQDTMKQLNISEMGIPHGTLTHVPVERLRQFDAEYKVMNESGVVKEDLKNKGDFYYNSGTNLYKIMDMDNFNPAMVTKAANVWQTKSFFEPTGDMPMGPPIKIIENKTLPGTFTPGMTEGVAGAKTGKQGDYEVPHLNLGGASYMPISPTVSKNLNSLAAKGFINLNEPDTYAGRLTKLSDEDAGKLQYGSLWELTDSTQKSLDNVKTSSPQVKDVSTPEGTISLAQTTLQQRIGQQLSVNTLKIAREKLFKASNTKDSIQSFFTGPRFRNVDTQSLTPDNPAATITGNNRITGFTDFSTLFNLNAEKGIVQGSIPGGVKSNPIYEMMDTHHLRIERPMDDLDAMRSSPLKGTKENNYRLLEEAVRQQKPGEVIDDVTGYTPNMMTFREKMVELVQTKIKQGNKFKDSTNYEIAMDDAKYKQVVLDVVDRPDNKYIRLPNKKDWLKKGKNRYKYINPDYDFKELPPVIPNRGFIENLRNQWTSQLIPVRSERGGTLGTENPISKSAVPFNASRLNMAIKWVSEKKGDVDRVTSESSNAFFNESWNKVILTFDRDELPRNLRGDWDRANTEGIRATDKGEQSILAYEAKELKRAEDWNITLDRKSDYEMKGAIDADVDEILANDVNYKKSSMTPKQQAHADKVADKKYEIEQRYAEKQSKLENTNKKLQKDLDDGFWFKSRTDPNDPTRTISKKMDLSQAQKNQRERKIVLNKQKLRELERQKKNDKTLKKLEKDIVKLKTNDRWTNRITNMKMTPDEISDVVGKRVALHKKRAEYYESQKFVNSRRLKQSEGNVGREKSEGNPDGVTAEPTMSADRGRTMWNFSLDDIRLSLTEKNIQGFTLNPAPMNRAQTETMVRGLLESKVGTTSISRATDPDRIKINKTILNMFQDALSTSEIKKASGSKSGMGAFAGSSKATQLMSTPSMQSALSQQLQLVAPTRSMSSSKLARESQKLPRTVQAFAPSYITDNLIRAKKAEQNTIGFGRQAAVAAPVTSNVATQQPFKQETEYAIPSLLAGPQASFTPQKNLLEQTMGDIQGTIQGINKGNKVISENQATQVKTYELPKGIASSMNIKNISTAIGGLSTNTKDTFGKILMAPKLNTELSTNVGTQGQGLLAGLNLNLGAISSTAKSQSTRTNTDVLTLLSLGYKSKQTTKQASSQILKQFIKNNYDTRVVPQSEQRLVPKQLKQAKIVPQRIFPIAPYITGFDPIQDAIKRRNMRPRLKKKKTWWQTPENWYEPYYWGGKNQEGIGYVNFTGKEPGKVKKYEKRHFGIGVNDSPFGIKGKNF